MFTFYVISSVNVLRDQNTICGKIENIENLYIALFFCLKVNNLSCVTSRSSDSALIAPSRYETLYGLGFSSRQR